MYKQPTKAIVMDAGFASRFLPITKTIPKAMIPLGNKPVMQVVIEECANAGIKEIILVATEEGKPIYENYFFGKSEKVKELLTAQGKAERFEPVTHVIEGLPKITIIVQDPKLPYGNGSPIATAKDHINDDEAFVALYSDDIVLGGEGAVKALVERYAEHPEAAAVIGVQEVEGREIEKYGSVKFKDGSEEVERVIEKPKMEDAPSQLASYGRYLLTPAVFEFLNPDETGKDGELWTADAVDKLASSGKPVFTAEAKNGIWYTTGDPVAYLAAHVEYDKLQS
ncbi:sugar phosphate nucleotidyltransferase [Candidatus Saccharibacteria bacterium]|nr:sugar phosphate nucleotidyltransferase [Candidatus Saccharibacteria bacterium]